MQKKLLGMAVAAALAAPAVALAQSAVQVYGTVHLSANQASYSSDTANTLNSVKKFGVTSHASNWGLRSTESLGGGMTAWFQAEFNMKMTRDNGVHDGESTARNSGVGLRGGFGNVYLGTWETPWAQTFRLWDVGTIGGWGPTTSIIGRRETTGTNPSKNCSNVSGAAGQSTLPTFGTPICGNGAEANNTALWRRFGYAIFYESPVFAGVQVKVAYDPNDRKADFTAPSATQINENPSAWSFSVTWTGLGGNARAFFATDQRKDWTTPGQTDSGFTVGGGYNFGIANVGAVMEDFKYKTATGDAKYKDLGAGIAVPIGSGKIGASYARAKDTTGPTPAPNDGAKMWNVGYQHDLSKRTAVGVGIAKISNDPDGIHTWTGTIPMANGWQSGAVPAGVDQRNLFVSVRHSF
jgi:predicted porin